MINKTSLRNLKEDDGFTLKKGTKVRYKTGYQVATNGVICDNINDAMNAIKAYNGNCGVWYHNKQYYIDVSKHIQGLKNALQLAKECNQLEIYKWKTNKGIWCGAAA